MGSVGFGFGDDLADQIRRLEVVQGEVDHVIEAAVRDMAENFSTAIRNAWPVGGASKAGATANAPAVAAKPGPVRPKRPRPKRKKKKKAEVVVKVSVKRPSPPGHRHSRTKWAFAKVGPAVFEVTNDADYSEYVHSHPNQGGPPTKGGGLAGRLFKEAAPQLLEDAGDFMSERVADLLAA